MTDHELITALYDEAGVISYCGGEGDAETALAFVRFVRGLPETRIHPDDVAENTAGDYETSPRWSALALEYVFSDRDQEEHEEVVIEFFATLPPAQRARAWAGVRAQATDSRLARSDNAKAIFDALDQRIERSA